MKRACRTVLLLASAALVTTGCSSRATTDSLSTVQSSPNSLTAQAFPMSSSDKLGYALYNTRRGMLARGYTNTPVPLPAVATVPSGD